MNKLLFLIILFPFGLVAQDNPGQYMNSLTENYGQINKDTWDYVKQASRGKNASKIEKRRVELSNTLRKAKYEIGKKPGYKGDKSLRDAYASYLSLSFYVIDDNYKKIVDLERIAEESYNDMEAYLLLKERVNEKLDSAFQGLKKIQTEFASKYNVNMVEGNSRISKKLTNASKINKYDNRIFLIFFKSSWYEAQMIEAQNRGDVGDMEQFRQALKQVSKEGMEDIKSIAAYEGDNSLKEAGFQMLEFYYGEAERYVPKQLEFYQKKDKMETAKRNFESKNEKELTKEDVDMYNNAVNNYNDAIRSFNETNEYLNKYRSKRLNNFNSVRQNFFNKYL